MGGVSLYIIILLSLWLLNECLRFPLYKLLFSLTTAISALSETDINLVTEVTGIKNSTVSFNPYKI